MIRAVPLFGRRSQQAPTEEELRAAAVDLERIRAGGIPLGAEQRLSRVGSAAEPLFTSDLSAKEYALAQASGLVPVAQVMGSSVVQHGWVGAQAGLYASGEIRALSEPWNMARERAFDRLRQEAQLAGADAVIGVEMRAGAIGDAGNVELVVFGTAVRESTLARREPGQPGMCTLSGQDVDKLRRIGAEVRGVVGHTTVISVQLSRQSSWIMNSTGLLAGGGARMNAEIPEIAQGVYDARNRAMLEVRRQANAVQANNIVVSTLRHTIEHREYEQMGYRYHFFHVTMNVLGTAIRLGAHPPHPAPLPTPTLAIDLRAG